MDTPLLIAVVTGLASLIGTVVGALTSFLTNRYATREKGAREDRLQRYQERESLYSDFLGEAMKMAVLVIKHRNGSVDEIEITRMVSLEARIWLHSQTAGAAARLLAKKVTKLAYPSEGAQEDQEVDSKSFAELRDTYVEICATELGKLRDEA